MKTIRVGLLTFLVLTLLLSGFGVGIASAQWIPEGCYRQEFHLFPSSAQKAGFTFVHLNGSGEPVKGCGAIVTVSKDGITKVLGKFDAGRVSIDVDRDGSVDVVISNYKYRSSVYGNKLISETRVWTFNEFFIVRIGEWNKSPGNG